MSYWGWGRFPRHVTVEERKRKAKRQLEKLLKKGVRLDPVTAEGRTIAMSWWGAHWNQNLERYADYAYRLDRGRSYVRSGAVLDLKIKSGLIQAMVAGSGRKPYDVKITIKRLDPGKWKELLEKTSGRIETVSGLLEGVFPHELGDLFFAENKGFFPHPKEIRFTCSCPDFASLCKHTAAALYGVGARLDKQPALFFTLRDVKMEELVGKAARHAAKRLLAKADGTSGSPDKKSRILKLGETGTDSVSKMFGISVNTVSSPDTGALCASATPSGPRKVPYGGSIKQTGGQTLKRSGGPKSCMKKNVLLRRTIKNRNTH